MEDFYHELQSVLFSVSVVPNHLKCWFNATDKFNLTQKKVRLINPISITSLANFFLRVGERKEGGGELIISRCCSAPSRYQKDINTAIVKEITETTKNPKSCDYKFTLA